MIKYIVTSFILVTNLSLYCSQKEIAHKDAKTQAEKAKVAQAIKAAAAKAKAPTASSKLTATQQRNYSSHDTYHCYGCGQEHSSDYQGQA